MAKIVPTRFVLIRKNFFNLGLEFAVSSSSFMISTLVDPPWHAIPTYLPQLLILMTLIFSPGRAKHDYILNTETSLESSSNIIPLNR